MEISRDYEDLFKVLNAYKIKYLIVGAYATIFYSEPRYTKDIDVWIPPTLNDPNEIYNALKEFGAPLKGISPEDFSDQKLIFQIGVPPVRIDIMMSVPGLQPRLAWKNKKKSRYGNTPVYVLGVTELIKAKKKAGRSQDLLDLEKLLRRVKE